MRRAHFNRLKKSVKQAVEIVRASKEPKARKPTKRERDDAARASGFDSPFETRVCKDLDDRGIEFQYHPYTIEWTDKSVRNMRCNVCGATEGIVKTRSYEPDLRIVVGDTPDRFRVLLVELKGRLTADDRKTLIGVRKELKEGTELVILLQRDNKLSKKWPRYSDWCRWAGFRYAVGERIPDEWLD